MPRPTTDGNISSSSSGDNTASSANTGSSVKSTSGHVMVNILDYANAMGAEIQNYKYNNQERIKITFGKISQYYILNSGIIDDVKLNEYFGLASFLTNQDREAEVGIEIFDGKLYYDVTIPMTKLFHNAKSQAEDKQWSFDKTLWFKDKVNHKADWDIKRADPWSRSVGTTYPGAHDAQIYFNGEYTTPEILENLLYGYAGAAAGFPYDILKLGSLYASGWSLSQNEADDHTVIRRGIEMYYDGF